VRALLSYLLHCRSPALGRLTKFWLAWIDAHLATVCRCALIVDRFHPHCFTGPPFTVPTSILAGRQTIESLISTVCPTRCFRHVRPRCELCFRWRLLRVRSYRILRVLDSASSYGTLGQLIRNSLTLSRSCYRSTSDFPIDLFVDMTAPAASNVSSVVKSILTKME
jgi:hypothetical protein